MIGNYWVLSSFLTKLERFGVRVENHVRNTRDARHLHAFQDLQQQIHQTLQTYQDKISGMTEPDEFDCESHQCHQLLPHRSALLYPPYCCHELQSILQEEAETMFQDWVFEQTSKSYYTWKTFGQGTPSPPINDPTSWQVVCVGDDGKRLLTHPLLHHPADFLTQETITGNRYADKARFAYYFKGSLTDHKVVFTREPSALPKLLPITT